MKATVSWKLDKETFVFSSLVWFSIVTLLSLPRKCPQTQRRTLCFCLGRCTGLLQSPTPDTLNQSPAGSTWIHTNYGSGWRELSCSCFSRLKHSARHFKINYSQIWVYIQAREWKILKDWMKDYFFLNGKTQLYPSVQSLIWYLCLGPTWRELMAGAQKMELINKWQQNCTECWKLKTRNYLQKRKNLIT